MNKNTERLLNCFLEVEESQYPECIRNKVIERHNIVRKFIDSFGCDYVTINTYTNMMQSHNSITLNVFNLNYLNGSIAIDLGSEPQELFASRVHRNKEYKKIVQDFNFNKWKWINRKENKK